MAMPISAMIGPSTDRGRVAHRAAQHHPKALEREQHAESRNDNADYSEQDTEYLESSAHAFSLQFVNW